MNRQSVAVAVTQCTANFERDLFEALESPTEKKPVYRNFFPAKTQRKLYKLKHSTFR